MSRIGKKPVNLGNSKVEYSNGILKVKGPKGELQKKINERLTIEIQGNQIIVNRQSEDKRDRALHGLYRVLIQNMIDGVTKGFEKKLEIVGVGYKAEQKGKNVLFSLGYSHPIYFMPPDEVNVIVESPTTLKVSGIDKELVGLVAAKIRSLKEPEPYKGKGIKYSDEIILRKAGKTAGK